jgi:hypothetical protein
MPPTVLARTVADPTSRLPDVSIKPGSHRSWTGPRSTTKPDRVGSFSSGGLSPDESLLNRIRGEFAEMPGLNLTIRQALRLFDLHEDACRVAFAVLVREGFLAQSRSGLFHRSWETP